MNITIDVGNSKTKVGIFNEQHALVEQYTYSHFGVRELSYLLNRFPITKGIIASVAPSPLLDKRQMLSRHLDQQTYKKIKDLNLLVFTNSTPIPITNGYLTPKTLGLDRLAAAVGAYAATPEENILVVDIGSAITYDFVSKEGIFVGGNIAPGIRMRLTVLHEMTDKLPSLHFEEDHSVPLLGATTTQAMISGVIKGIAFEVEGYIQSLIEGKGAIQIYLTGGQEAIIAQHLKHQVHEDRHLVLKGLNRILEYNQP